MDELVEHHELRAAETMALVEAAPGVTCWEVTRQLTWSRNWDDITGFMRRAAVGETLAHLVLLESRQRVRRDLSDGPVHWYPAG